MSPPFCIHKHFHSILCIFRVGGGEVTRGDYLLAGKWSQIKVKKAVQDLATLAFSKIV